VLRPLVHELAAVLGETSEVVLHDFSDLEHSIVEIAGNVTGRRVGGSVTQIGLALAAQGNDAQSQIGYLTRTATGRVLKSSTLLLRDQDGRVFGALCVNVDVTQFRVAARLLADLAGPAGVAPADIDFSDDIRRVLEAEVEQIERTLGRSPDFANKADRMEVVAALKRRGAFAVQRAVPYVAQRLGVSRATIYTYLEEIRQSSDGDQDASDGN
jgi:predicted transcriptional regulator YheO